MPAHTGRDVTVEFALAAETASVGSLTWLALGMMRSKSIKTSWDTADTTADKSPAYTKTQLVTFKSVEFSGDGVSYNDAIHNQQTLEAAVVSPGAGTGFQPKAWFRLTYPNGKTYVGPFIVTEWANDSAYSDATTWSISAMSNGSVVMTPGS